MSIRTLWASRTHPGEIVLALLMFGRSTGVLWPDYEQGGEAYRWALAVAGQEAWGIMGLACAITLGLSSWADLCGVRMRALRFCAALGITGLAGGLSIGFFDASPPAMAGACLYAALAFCSAWCCARIAAER